MTQIQMLVKTQQVSFSFMFELNSNKLTIYWEAQIPIWILQGRIWDQQIGLYNAPQPPLHPQLKEGLSGRKYFRNKPEVPLLVCVRVSKS